MKRSNVSVTKGRFTSGSFLKVLMPKINKDSKRNPSGNKRSAPNLAGGGRISG
jgi:hypothetical protein